jgi:kynurenine formamidase
MGKRIIDLSLEIYHSTPVFPQDPHTGFIAHQTIEDTGYNITQIIMSTHVGTHLDAPHHFIAGGRTVDKLDLEKCVGPAMVINMSHKEPKEEIRIKDFAGFEKRIVKDSKVLIRTDWARFFPDKTYFFDSPVITVETARWLGEREIGLLGVEVPSVNAQDYMETHKILLGKEIVIVEALTNLSQLARDEVYFIALPLKLRGLDGSPVRAIAIEE